LARAKPGQLNFGNPGTGSSIDLSAQKLFQAAHIKLTNVGYKGQPPALVDLMTNLMHFEIVSLALAARGGRSIKLMDWTTLTFFAIASVLTIGIRSTTFPVYIAVVVWLCFAIAAWSSVIVGRPFTEVYARENAPPEFWNNPVFVRLNLIMTLVWCGLMTVNVGFAAIGVIIGGKLAPPLFGFAMPTALLICGFIFNSRFPAEYLARSGFQMAPASAPASNA